MGIFVRSEPTKHTYSVQGQRKYYFSTNYYTILHKNMKLLSLFLIPAIFAQSTKQKAADNAKENAENYACFSCGYNSLNQAGDPAQCQNPVQGQTKQVSCPKDKYCFTVNTVTTPRNASSKIPQKTDILRGCYNLNKKPANYEDQPLLLDSRYVDLILKPNPMDKQFSQMSVNAPKFVRVWDAIQAHQQIVLD